jgi:hypothetical protein
METKLLLTASLAAAAALAGCSKQPDVDAKNASVEEVQKQVSKSDIRPRPGRWRQEVRIESIDMPNMPVEMKAQMANQAKMVHAGYTCLTPEQAEKPDASFFQQAAKGCTYDHFRMADGTLDAKMTCTVGETEQVSTMKGTFGPESYDLKIDMRSPVMGQSMHSVLSLKMTRVGECTGDEDARQGG